MKKVLAEGIRVVKPGGSYAFVGLVHPNSKFDVTAEQIIRKCLTIRGMMWCEKLTLLAWMTPTGLYSLPNPCIALPNQAYL